MAGESLLRKTASGKKTKSAVKLPNIQINERPLRASIVTGKGQLVNKSASCADWQTTDRLNSAARTSAGSQKWQNARRGLLKRSTTIVGGLNNLNIGKERVAFKIGSPQLDEDKIKRSARYIRRRHTTFDLNVNEIAPSPDLDTESDTYFSRQDYEDIGRLHSRKLVQMRTPMSPSFPTTPDSLLSFIEHTLQDSFQEPFRSTCRTVPSFPALVGITVFKKLYMARLNRIVSNRYSKTRASSRYTSTCGDSIYPITDDSGDDDDDIEKFIINDDGTESCFLSRPVSAKSTKSVKSLKSNRSRKCHAKGGLPRFSARLSDEAQCATLKGYDDLLVNTFEEIHPKYKRLFERSTTSDIQRLSREVKQNAPLSANGQPTPKGVMTPQIQVAMDLLDSLKDYNGESVTSSRHKHMIKHPAGQFRKWRDEWKQTKAHEEVFDCPTSMKTVSNVHERHS